MPEIPFIVWRAFGHTALVTSGALFVVFLLTILRRLYAPARLSPWLLRVTHRHVMQIAQSSLCHRFHIVLQRLSRWLLVYVRCLRTTSIDLTQDRLAQELGCPRSTVSMAAVALQDTGYVRLRHGRIPILDRAGLSAVACECAHIGSVE